VQLRYRDRIALSAGRVDGQNPAVASPSPADGATLQQIARTSPPAGDNPTYKQTRQASPTFTEISDLKAGNFPKENLPCIRFNSGYHSAGHIKAETTHPDSFFA
jgi:hypothetical protein